MWEGVYQMGTGVATLNYLSLGLGFVIGLLICAPLIDRVHLSPNPRLPPFPCILLYHQLSRSIKLMLTDTPIVFIGILRPQDTL